MIDRQNVFDQPIRNDLITYDNIWKVATGQGDDYTTGCLVVNKQQALPADPKTMQQIDFIGNLE